MRVIFLLQKEAWFVEHEHSWYRLESTEDVRTVLGALALHMVDQQSLIEQPHHAGSARVIDVADKSFSIELAGPDKKRVDTLTVKLVEDRLLDVNWKTMPFADGWMNAEAELTVHHVREMYLDVYLPAVVGSKGKMLSIHDTQADSVREAWIARDTTTRISLVEKGRAGKVDIKLTCAAESVDKSTDPRLLGFVLVAQNARPVV